MPTPHENLQAAKEAYLQGQATRRTPGIRWAIEEITLAQLAHNNEMFFNIYNFVAKVELAISRLPTTRVTQ
jgi:hypothetical protein